MKHRHTAAFILVALTTPTVVQAAIEVPPTVAPGGASQVRLIESPCPTFSWGVVESASQYELMVLGVEALGGMDPALPGTLVNLREVASINAVLPGTASGWTPSLDRCLAANRDYVWVIRASLGRSWGSWSEPRFFRVQAATSDERLRDLVLEILAEEALMGRRGTERVPARPIMTSGGAGLSAPPAHRIEPEPAAALAGTSGVLSEVAATSGVVTFGVQGVSNSSDDGSAGVAGVSSAVTGAVRGVHGESASDSGFGVYGRNTSSTSFNGLATGVRGEVQAPFAFGVYGWHTTDNGAGAGVRGDTSSPSGFGGFFSNLAGGTLLAAGDGADTRFRVDSSGNVYADGSYNCGAGISDAAGTLDESEIAPCLLDDSPADFAEMLPTAGDTLEAGDVLALDESGSLVASTAPYQSSVVGVYSTRPSYLGNSRHANERGFAPVALVGIVPVKVTAENGRIRAGDLLVSSSLPGHAMRGGDDSPQGVIIGKALEALAEGTGVVRIIAMLQ